MRVFAPVSQHLCVCDTEGLLFPLETVPITSGLIRHHFALARRQLPDLRTLMRMQEFSCLSALFSFDSLLLSNTKEQGNKILKTFIGPTTFKVVA